MPMFDRTSSSGPDKSTGSNSSAHRGRYRWAVGDVDLWTAIGPGWSSSSSRAGQHDQADPGCGIDPPRLYATFDLQRQLAAQEEILGAEGFGRTEKKHHPPQRVLDQTECDPREGDHALIVPQRSVLSLPRATLPSRMAFLRRTGLVARRR